MEHILRPARLFLEQAEGLSAEAAKLIEDSYEPFCLWVKFRRNNQSFRDFIK